jgi:hypothetical protein
MTADSGPPAPAWHELEPCCDDHAKAGRAWVRELVGTVLEPPPQDPRSGPQPMAGGRSIRILAASEVEGAIPDDLGLAGVAIDLRRVRLQGPPELAIEDEWDAAAGRYRRSIRSDPGADPPGAAFRQAWLVARHVFDGTPYRGRGGAPKGREADIGRVAAAIIELTALEGRVPSQDEVCSKVGYKNVENLRRAVPWADALVSARAAYQAAGALRDGGRWAWQPWRAAWAWSRGDLEQLGQYDEGTHRLLLEASELAAEAALGRWARRHGLRIIRGRP